MKYYVIAVFLSIAIIVAIIFMWINWGINLIELTTGVSVGLILSIPFLFKWAFNQERKQKRTISKVSKTEQNRLFKEFENEQKRKEIESLDYEFDDESTEK